MKSKENKPFIRVISETAAGDGFVDCVWEMPTWFAEKLETEDNILHAVFQSVYFFGQTAEIA